MPPNYKNQQIRAAAAARAAKMMRLFSKPNFENIMEAVDPIPNEAAFTVACQQAGLVPSEITWLWKYLENCKFALYDPIPDAALSGW